MSRESTIVKVGRIIQKYSIYWKWVDHIEILKKKKDKTAVVILATPRSGSTLTYQVIRTALNGYYLSNIWNLLYATPFLGGTISNILCKSKTSTFKSKYGFVEGLRGEAEGLKFWEYWTGQGLKESDKWNQKKAKQLSRKLSKIGNKKQIFITGFLGHAFCINEINKVFENVVFIHLSRHIIPNAISILKASKNEYFSTLPLKLENNLPLSREEQVIKQIFEIHKTIIRDRENKNFIDISYEGLCMQPMNEINKIIEFSKVKNINIFKSGNILPKSFTTTTPNIELYKKLEPLVNKELNNCSIIEQKYFEKLL